MNYADFLKRKQRVFHGDGITSARLSTQLYDWQRAIVRWALKKGRAAIFADCGLGKTFMQCAWAHALGCPTLILAPLCVAEQTVAEAAKLKIKVRYARNQQEADAGDELLIITNYERLDDFDAGRYSAVVLDESSILKAFDGKTRTKLIKTFQHATYRLCCTATPSPNDIAELANHAEFLGLMTRAEFLATWFVHDDAGWRMKRHAVEPFYRWLASWAIAMRKPSDSAI
jgi:superfamily II DNA or RNA helicase